MAARLARHIGNAQDIRPLDDVLDIARRVQPAVHSIHRHDGADGEDKGAHGAERDEHQGLREGRCVGNFRIGSDAGRGLDLFLFRIERAEPENDLVVALLLGEQVSFQFAAANFREIAVLDLLLQQADFLFEFFDADLGDLGVVLQFLENAIGFRFDQEAVGGEFRVGVENERMLARELRCQLGSAAAAIAILRRADRREVRMSAPGQPSPCRWKPAGARPR